MRPEIDNPLKTRLSRRGTIKLAAGTALAAAMPLDALAQDASPSPELDGMSPSPMLGVPNAYWKYPDPFTTVAATPGKGGKVSFLFFSDLNVKSRDDSQYWQELEHRLGVTLDVTFVPGANYAEKMATAFAGGDFPDIMHVITLAYPQISEFMLQGAFTDITSYLDGDARHTFPNLNAMPSYAFENSKLNGVLFGVPSPTSLQPNGLWYRGDWLTKLGATPPANADEFLNMIDRFAKEDPDGNGSADTYGNSFDNLNPFETRFAHAMFRVPAEGDGFGFNPIRTAPSPTRLKRRNSGLVWNGCERCGRQAPAIQTRQHRTVRISASSLWVLRLARSATPTFC